MSGVEVAGFVLAGIPLIISGLEHYAEGVETIKRLWRYRREFQSLILRLQVENDIFRNTCELLLNGLARDNEMTELLEYIGGPAWSRPDMERKLKARLRDSYEGYLATVRDMAVAVDTFQRRLRLNADGKGPFKDKSTFKEAYKRFSFGLSKSSYEDLMIRIKDDNSALERLTAQSTVLESARSRRNKRSPDFKTIREFAISVYGALRSGLLCSCRASHRVNLGLESRLEHENATSSEGTSFRVVFSHSMYEADDAIRRLEWQWEEAEMRLIDHPDPEEEPQTALQTRGVRFGAVHTPKKTPAIPMDQQPTLEQIQNLCEAIQRIRALQNGICLGYIIDGPGKIRHGLYPPRKRLIASSSWKIVYLKDILGGRVQGLRRLRPATKCRIALTLASSTLQLHGTPWLPDGLSKDDVAFLQHDEKVLVDHPFVPKSMYLEGSSNPASTSIDRGNRFGLNVRNEAVFALGVLLIELCLGSPIEDLRQSSIEPLHGNQGFVMDFRSLDRLIDDVKEEAGLRYSDAVRRCIYCDFDQRKASLEDDNFHRAFYNGVVSTLEEDLSDVFGLH